MFVGTNTIGETYNSDIWNVLKPRITAFLEKEYEIYHKYRKGESYNRASDWWKRATERKEDVRLDGVNLGVYEKDRDYKTMVLVFSYDYSSPKGRSRSYFTICKSLQDFLDPDFETNYVIRLRDKKLERVTNKINKLMDTLGELLEEQQKLQKEKEEDN